MKYTEIIDGHLKRARMHWSKLPIPRSTLDACKRTDTYTTAQLHEIAQALGMEAWELLRPAGEPRDATELMALAVDELRAIRADVAALRARLDAPGD